MPGIFICYRREDAADAAGRMYDRLSAHFGKTSIFMDIDNIPLGVDFVEVIEDRVGSCDALIAVIGKQWLKTLKRRLKSSDFVRLEIMAALSRNIRIIPALINGAAMPQPADLPQELAKLARRNGLDVPYATFHSAVDHLIQELTQILAESTRQRATEAARHSSSPILLQTPSHVISTVISRDYWFFLSYARANFDPSLEKFFIDLQEEVYNRTGERNNIGFMDSSSIETGVVWESVLSEAMRTSRTAVCVYSPAYVNSAYCGKELSVFLSRRSASTAGPSVGAIVPVPWTPLRGPLPEVLSQFQIFSPEFPDAYRTEGLRYLIKLARKEEYAQIVMGLAKAIVEHGSRAPLPPIATLPPLDQIPSAFGEARAESVNPPTAALQIFLSYDPTDLAKVRELYEHLRKAGLRPWMDDSDLAAGEDWHAGTKKALLESDLMLICLSPQSARKSGAVPSMIDYSRWTAVEGQVRTSLIRLEPVAIPVVFKGYMFVDLFEPDGYDRLFQMLARMRKRERR